MNATAELFRRALGERRSTLIGLTVGAIGMCALALAMYPSLREQLGALTAVLPPEITAFFGADMVTPAGYVSSQVFTKIAPLLVMISAIGAGALPCALERDGVLAVTLAAPVRRAQIITAHALAIVTEVAVLAAAVGAVLIALREPTGLDIPLARLLAGTVALALLGAFHGLLTLTIGAASGSRGLAVGVGTGVALGGFLLSGLAPLVGSDLLGFLSPFHWAFGAQPLEAGWSWAVLSGLLALAAGSVLLAAAAALLFRRRDIG
ncbi:ABC transporter permease subunit [Allokutzneria sp. NRRL B-24872]|uniref:ABC transporter permease subunit n=1 Tax=Allokutzneria sp. NRRL B-24872 TaxID=1137961 RepID=UPI000A37F6E0|nr:ABC transporter permease subunit [Allokutzneria sp. NRRL B-24872]